MHNAGINYFNIYGADNGKKEDLASSLEWKDFKKYRLVVISSLQLLSTLVLLILNKRSFGLKRFS